MKSKVINRIIIAVGIIALLTGIYMTVTSTTKISNCQKEIDALNETIKSQAKIINNQNNEVEEINYIELN